MVSLLHKKSRMELGCAIMTVDSESQVCGMHKKSRVELACCAIMTVESESKVCGMDKTSK